MHRFLKLSLTLMTLSLICWGLSLAAAVNSGPRVAPAVYAQRRAEVIRQIGKAVAIIQSAEETRSYTQFRQSNEFYYLTGIEDTASSILVMDGRTGRTILFLPPYSARYEQWDGHRLAPGKEATERTGISETRPITEFAQVLDELTAGDHKVIYTPLTPEELLSTSRDRAQALARHQLSTPWDKRISREQAFANYLETRKLDVRDLSLIVDEMRRIKGPTEIELLRRASQLGSEGHIEVLKNAKPGMYEYQIAALAEYVFKRSGALGAAYFAIAGSGPNSCVLHYNQIQKQMKEGELVVFDFGPDYGYYTSDITRTFPVSGKFTAEQRKVYQACLNAQKAAIAAVKPGATFAEINKAARDVIDAAGYGKYWVHGTSHFIGMAVHDVGDYAKPLEPGVVITVEPGIYIREKDLGVRIEDVVLVTKDGHEVLSTAPKEIHEIEQLMSSGKTRK